MDRGMTQMQWTSMRRKPNLRSMQSVQEPMDDPNSQKDKWKLSRYWEDASNAAKINILPTIAPSSRNLPECQDSPALLGATAGTGRQAEDHRTLDRILMPNRLTSVTPQRV